MASRLWRLCLIILATLCTLPTLLADQFTNPSNSVNDLTISYALGQVVQVAWDTEVTQVTLLVSHWGGDAVGALLSDAANPGAFTWTIGQNDNMNDVELQKGSNYVFVLEGVGTCPDYTGWVNCQLQSRAFRVISNATTSSASSPSSLSSSSSPPSPPSPPSSSSVSSSSPPLSSSSSTSSTSTPLVSSSMSSSSITTTTTAAIQSSASAVAASVGLSTGAKAGISVAAVVGGIALVGFSVGITLFCVRRSRKSKEQKQKHELMGELPRAPTSTHGAPELGGYNYAYKQPLESQPPSELATKSYSDPAVHEMGPGSPTQTRSS